MPIRDIYSTHAINLISHFHFQTTFFLPRQFPLFCICLLLFFLPKVRACRGKENEATHHLLGVEWCCCIAQDFKFFSKHFSIANFGSRNFSSKFSDQIFLVRKFRHRIFSPKFFCSKNFFVLPNFFGYKN